MTVVETIARAPQKLTRVAPLRILDPPDLGYWQAGHTSGACSASCRKPNS